MSSKLLWNSIAFFEFHSNSNGIILQFRRKCTVKEGVQVQVVSEGEKGSVGWVGKSERRDDAFRKPIRAKPGT